MWKKNIEESNDILKKNKKKIMRVEEIKKKKKKKLINMLWSLREIDDKPMQSKEIM